MIVKLFLKNFGSEIPNYKQLVIIELEYLANKLSDGHLAHQFLLIKANNS